MAFSRRDSRESHARRLALASLAALMIFALMIFAVSLAASPCRAQAAAEAAAATGAASVSAGSSKPAAPANAKSGPASASPHLSASDAPASDEANRKNFEEHAGRNPGKLMLHSTPTGAQVYVNGLYVGHAPLLLLLAPAKYKIEMRGARQESGRRTIMVAAGETQEVVVTLSSLYPGKVSTR
jgi:hypothetical protein